MPAVVASQHDPIIKAFYERLLEKGKKPLCALVAIMRKLLHGIIGMFKTGTDFDAQRLFPNIPAVRVSTPKILLDLKESIYRLERAADESMD